MTFAHPAGDEAFWLWGLRAAGAAHLVTVVIAWFTPIPPDWEKNLAMLPESHRRFAIAQNAFIGAVLVFNGVVSLVFAPALLDGSVASRVLCAGIALWWGARVIVLQWLRVGPHLHGPWLRAGWILLHAECVLFAGVYGWLALSVSAPR